jgi:hypothetical protein
MIGWVAVIACYWTSATLLAHVPEPINQLVEGLVGKKSVLIAHMPEPLFSVRNKKYGFGTKKIGVP